AAESWNRAFQKRFCARPATKPHAAWPQRRRDRSSRRACQELCDAFLVAPPDPRGACPVWSFDPYLPVHLTRARGLLRRDALESPDRSRDGGSSACAISAGSAAARALREVVELRGARGPRLFLFL